MANKLKNIFRKSNNNTIFQNNNINNPTFNIYSNNRFLDMLKNKEEIETIQMIAKQTIEDFGKTHHLYPDYIAKYDYKLGKLISSPTTEEALKKYPKNVKGTFEWDLKKYPCMDKRETPWEYAYRTQTDVEVKTTKYKEYLGDCEDPFPIIDELDSMTTIIKPPKFPEPVDVLVISGDACLHMKLQRVPCLEYGKTIIESFGEEQILKLKITFTKENSRQSKFSITKNEKVELKQQLAAEQFIESIKETANIKIKLGEIMMLDSNINKDGLESKLFKNVEYRIEYLKNLIFIEDYYGIKFEPLESDLSEQEYIGEVTFVRVLYASLNHKRLLTKSIFDNRIRFDYNTITNNLLDDVMQSGNLDVLYRKITYRLRGYNFLIDKYFISFNGVKINNYKSIVKNIKRKKKEILMTFKPQDGANTFDIFEKFENINLN